MYELNITEKDFTEPDQYKNARISLAQTLQNVMSI